MKNVIRLIVSLLIIAALAALLTSCGPEHLDDRPYEQVVIDPAHTESYGYSNSVSLESGWEEVDNTATEFGSPEGYFYFTVEGDLVTLTKNGIMAEVRYYPRADHPGYGHLEVVGNTVKKINVTPEGTFRIYNSLMH